MLRIERKVSATLRDLADRRKKTSEISDRCRRIATAKYCHGSTRSIRTGNDILSHRAKETCCNESQSVVDES